MPRKATIESYTRCFQFRIINNALFLNSQLYKFGLVDSSKCSFCGMIDETTIHFFSECNITLDLWQKAKNLVETISSIAGTGFEECPISLQT